MFSTGLIVFREALEAALFVGIVAASSRGLAGRDRWLAGGVLAGALASLLLAAGIDRVSAWADGLGQDLLNALVLCCALLMLAWHCIWVSTRSADTARDAGRLGSAAATGGGTLAALALAVALAVLREGAETVLFVAGLMSGTAGGRLPMLAGAGAGLLGGILAGVLVCNGLARIRTRHLFAVTNALVLILAGSLASQLARSLGQAGLVAAWSDPVWNAPAWLSNDTSPGILLHALVGYESSPSGLQFVAYVGTVAFIWFAAKASGERAARQRRTAPAV